VTTKYEWDWTWEKEMEDDIWHGVYRNFENLKEKEFYR